MPDFDFDAFNHDTPYEGEDGQAPATNVSTAVAEASEATTTEVPVAETSEATATEVPVIEPVAAEEKTETPTETNNGSVDNGSTEVAEKW